MPIVPQNSVFPARNNHRGPRWPALAACCSVAASAATSAGKPVGASPLKGPVTPRRCEKNVENHGKTIGTCGTYFEIPKILIFNWNVVENHGKTTRIWKLNGINFGEIFDDLPGKRSQDPPFSVGNSHYFNCHFP